MQVVVVQKDKTEYPLVNVEKPAKGSYLRLETFSKEKNFDRAVHVLLPNPAKATLKLGRGHEADLKIADISVSRVHAQITLTTQGFLLQDNKSKFGTLLLLSPTYHEIDPTSGLSVQVNRTILTFHVKPKEDLAKGKPLAHPQLAEEAAREDGNNSDAITEDDNKKLPVPDALPVSAIRAPNAPPNNQASSP